MPEDQVVRDVILASQPNKRFVTLEELGSGGVPVLASSGFDHRRRSTRLKEDGRRADANRIMFNVSKGERYVGRQAASQGPACKPVR